MMWKSFRCQFRLEPSLDWRSWAEASWLPSSRPRQIFSKVIRMQWQSTVMMTQSWNPRNFDRMTSPSGAIKNVPKFPSEFWRMDIDGRMLWTWFSRSQLDRLPMSRWSFLRRGGQRHWTRTWPSKTYKTDRALEDPGFTLVLSCFYHFLSIFVCQNLMPNFTCPYLFTLFSPQQDTYGRRLGRIPPPYEAVSNHYTYYTVDVIHCTPRPIFTFCVKHRASSHIWFNSSVMVWFFWINEALHVCMLCASICVHILSI